MMAWDKTIPSNDELLINFPAQARANWEAIELGTDANLLITNAKCHSSMGLIDTKLAQITTASKVHGTSITGLASLPGGAGLIPVANIPNLNASKITTGTLVVGRGGTGATAAANAANGVVILDGSSKLPAVDGSQLTNLVLSPPEGFIWGYELTEFVIDAVEVIPKQGVMVHGASTVKTVAPLTALNFDTAGDYYDGNLPSYDPTEGWNYVGVDASGNGKLLGTNSADVSSYISDSSQGSTTGSAIYFWDAGNSKHWRIVGSAWCYEVTGVVKAKFAQRQRGNVVWWDDPRAVSGITPIGTWTTVDLSSFIPAISTMGIFTAYVAGRTNSATEISMALRPLGGGDAGGNSHGVSTGSFVNDPYRWAVGGELWCATDSDQKIEHRESSAAQNEANLWVKGYVLDIR